MHLEVYILADSHVSIDEYMQIIAVQAVVTKHNRTVL